MEDKKKQEAPKAVKRIKPKAVQCHIAVPTKKGGGGDVSASLGTKAEHKFTMELHPAGVILRYNDSDTHGKLIPYTNIQHIDVEFEE